jgi:Interferon-induced transmembrane protein
MSQQPYDARTADQARPHYPPPNFPPPSTAPAYPHPGAGAYLGTPPSVSQVDPPSMAWRSGPVPTPSPMWGLTIPAAVLAFPLGLIAVYFSSRVNQHLQVGDMAGAAKSAGLAKTWGIVFLVLGAISTLFYLASA